MDAHRKLLIWGINKLVSDKLISLRATGDDRTNPDEAGHLVTELFGEPTVILWANIGFEELRISVWWKFDHGRHPQANKQGNFRERFQTSAPLAKRQHYPKFVGATVSGWLERKNGPYLQGKNSERLFDLYTRRGETASLEALPVPEPLDFGPDGKFYL
ncbi:MAG: hypothetical protein ACXWVJ_01560 [Caulobacteraceae bacterium]